MSKLIQHGLMAILLSVTLCAQSNGESSIKIAPDLQLAISGLDSGLADEDVDVIVQFQPTANFRAALSQLSRRSSRTRTQSELSLIHSAMVRVPLSELNQLAGSADVIYVSPDRTIQPTLDHARAATQTDAVWNMGLGGAKVRVAVIDSGITANEAFAGGTNSSRIVYEKSFVPGVASANDGYGHGSHVASIIGGHGEGSNMAAAKLRGIAPYVELVNLRVLDDNGEGKDSA